MKERAVIDLSNAGWSTDEIADILLITIDEVVQILQDEAHKE